MQTHLIIGGRSGIGLATANMLLTQGHRVVSLSRSTSGIKNQNYIEFVCDVLQPELLPVLDMPLQSLIYCPGSITLKPIRSLQIADFTSDFNINVLGAVSTIQHFLQNLKKAETPAAIVLFSTVAVQMGMTFHASIAAAKGAVEGLTRSLAAELAPGIRVNCIAPSLTNTPLAERLLNSEDKLKGAAERHPLKTVAKADDMAAAVLFLIESRFTTGQIVKVDGGMSSVR